MFLKLLSMYVGEERMGKFEPTDSIPGPRPCVSPGASSDGRMHMIDSITTTMGSSLILASP